MAYRWKADKSVRANLRRLVSNQLRSAIDQLNDRQADRADAVHEARLHLKKARSLLRLARPALDDTYVRENARLRDVAHQLSSQRDAQAMIEAVAKLSAHAEHQWGCSGDPLTLLRTIRDHLVGQQAAEQRDALEEVMPELTGALSAAADEVERWAACVEDGDAIMAGFAGSYRRGRRALRRALRQTTPENLHEWRKESKYHRYQVRLFQDAWPTVFEARYAELKRLSDLLGDDHDLVVLCQRVSDESPASFDDAASGGFRQVIARRRGELQAEALPLGRLLFAERPKQIARRFQKYLRIGYEEENRKKG